LAFLFVATYSPCVGLFLARQEVQHRQATEHQVSHQAFYLPCENL